MRRAYAPSGQASTGLAARDRGLDFAAVAEVDAGQLERVLGRPDWQTMSFGQLNARARELETAASFARTLGDYLLDADFDTAGDALAALADRNGNGAR